MQVIKYLKPKGGNRSKRRYPFLNSKVFITDSIQPPSSAMDAILRQKDEIAKSDAIHF